MEATLREGTGYAEVVGALDGARVSLGALPSVHEADSPDGDADLAALLSSLNDCASLVCRDAHYELVERLFDGITAGKGLTPWFLGSQSRRALLNVVTNLVVSGTMARTALEFLVRSLHPPLGLRQWTGPAPDEQARRRRQRQIAEDLRHCLASCLRMAPTLHEEVAQLVCSKFPHKWMDLVRTEAYLDTAFWLARGPLRHAADRILARAVQLLVELDVEANFGGVAELPLASAEYFPSPSDQNRRLSDGRLGNGNGNNLDELDEADMFEVCTVEEAEQGFRLPAAKQQAPTPTKPSHPPLDPNLDKADAILHAVLCFVRDAAEDGQGAVLLECLLLTFRTTVFPVRGTRIAQFPVFYAGHLTAAKSGNLAQFLADAFRDPKADDEQRARAALHLGSLVARSEDLPFAVAFDAMALLAHWCLHFCQHHHQPRAQIPEAQGAAFSCAFRGLLHALAFASPTAQDHSQLRALCDLCERCVLRVCSHWSQPFGTVPRAEADTFLRQARRLGLLGPDAIQAMGRAAQEADGSGGAAMLSEPFAMVDLPRSGPFVGSLAGYRWQPAKATLSAPKELSAEFRVGSAGQRSDTSLGQSPGFGGSYLSDEGEYFAGNSREAWFAGSQRPVPIGMKAQELVNSFGGGSPGLGVSFMTNSISTDLENHSPDLAMSLGTSLTDNKFLKNHLGKM